MWNITFEEWHETTENFLSISSNKLNKHLQTYPFSILSENDKNYLTSKDFFVRFIKNGKFLGSDKDLVVINNLLQKNNGNFRSVSLVSPIIYLVFIAMGGHLSNAMNQDSEHVESFYAGNFDTGELYYAKNYKAFSIRAKEFGSVYDYYLKLDVTNFFPSLDLPLLFEEIQKNIPMEDLRSLMLYRNLLEYFGNGKFPVIDGNPGLSFIATNCYLSKFDNELSKNIKKSSNILRHRIIRYVDDTYIFFDCEELPVAKEELSIITQDVSDSCKINLNYEKQKWGRGENVSDDVEQNLYDYEVNGEDIQYGNYYNEDNLKVLFKRLMSLNRESKREDIELAFSDAFRGEFDFKYTEILNWYLYDRPAYFQREDVSSIFFKITNEKNYLFRYYAKQFTRMLINTRSQKAIKKFLNDTFVLHRKSHLAKYQILMIKEYLLTTNFKHMDLLEVLREENSEIYSFINKYCLNNWVNKYDKINYKNKFIEKLDNDYILNYQFFMFNFYKKKTMLLEEYAYFKNYFDRKIAYLFAALDVNGTYKKSKKNHPISWQFTYNEGNVIKSLEKFEVSKELMERIRNAYDLRNKNPISHASSEVLLDDSLRADDFNECITAMKNVMEILSTSIKNG